MLIDVVIEKLMLSGSVDLGKRIDVVVIIAPHRREKKTDCTIYQQALQSLLVLRFLIFFIILGRNLSSLRLIQSLVAYSVASSLFVMHQLL